MFKKHFLRVSITRTATCVVALWVWPSLLLAGDLVNVILHVVPFSCDICLPRRKEEKCKKEFLSRSL